MVTPHPDDETLCCGGLIQAVLARGGTARVVSLTAGDGYVEAVRRETQEPTPRPAEYERYGETRIGELRRAMHVLGGGRVRVDDLGLPDGGLRALLHQHWARREPERSATTQVEATPYPDALAPGERYDGQDAVRLLRRLVSETHATLVALPDPADAHPDHAAAGQLALLALRPPVGTAGKGPSTSPPRVLAYLVHWPGWPSEPSAPATAGDPYPALELPRALAAGSWPVVALPLTREETARKVAALHEHATQERAMGSFLDRFARSTEPFREVGPDAIERAGQQPDTPLRGER